MQGHKGTCRAGLGEAATDGPVGGDSRAPGTPRVAHMDVWATQSLTKRFGSFTAVDDLTVSVGPGVTGVVGHNGAGKSTLIRMLLGLEPPTSGTATVFGIDAMENPLEARSRVGFMPEYDCFAPDVSAAQAIMHYGRLSGLPKDVSRERAADVLRHVGLDEARHRPVGSYSTGMKQRAKLAQALVHDPDLVLLDEPTNGLDPAGRDEMLSLVSRIGHEFGISVLVTSHLLGELERICDHVVVLDGGRLTTSASIHDLTQDTGALEVEVDGPPEAPDQLVEGLRALGLEAVRSTGAVLVGDSSPASRAAVVDLVTTHGWGLVRLDAARHQLTELFVGEEVR
ncbi:ABC-2 type transport system ATP-binding protein [Kytococcus aerolatus]|uniref:ABC-2 type transport system ATP-binding protein n=2 Tax=Kytococcus aerolatus TaxID=592308 RepID=A0A212U7S1_9MICO|nr:ABC-2 type transport system ATP-binding protein [Kytococcus aerolatus]